MNLLFRWRNCFPASLSLEMTFLFLSNASHSRRLPSSSVAFLLLRPPCAPPPEPPSPPTPPEPPDPPDSQICFTFADSYAQSLSSSSLPDLVSLILHISSAISESPSPTSSITDFFIDVFLLADDTTFLPQYFPQLQGALCAILICLK
ncbi:hypothetical protein AT2G16018 [Arabidopsis thaliana]|uniref:Uncharacterized protein n=1 Tax=Arabidopsis thaliana TaxID=3702 RepID=F4IJF2_ARATH|nr:uncharacterized protein AT2G16018 [Arabidopsis thaliana]AEC06457.1 hypothetical protein AT2G16018 [Arabidopsis thaliana]|eukprot:NP_001154522.1 hypothetical protein AT2G16018 [Arabidopsis thaliana]